MAEQYLVNELVHKLENDIEIEGWANAMDYVEEYCAQFDEQVFMGIWLKESGDCMAVYDGKDWLTK